MTIVVEERFRDKIFPVEQKNVRLMAVKIHAGTKAMNVVAASQTKCSENQIWLDLGNYINTIPEEESRWYVKDFPQSLINNALNDLESVVDKPDYSVLVDNPLTTPSLEACHFL